MFHPRAKAVYEKSAGIQPVMEMSQARRQRFRIHAMIICARYAYRLGMMGNDEYSDDQALGYLQEYAKLFNLDKKSGIELRAGDI